MDSTVMEDIDVEETLDHGAMSYESMLNRPSTSKGNSNATLFSKLSSYGIYGDGRDELIRKSLAIKEEKRKKFSAPKTEFAKIVYDSIRDDVEAENELCRTRKSNPRYNTTEYACTQTTPQKKHKESV